MLVAGGHPMLKRLLLVAALLAFIASPVFVDPDGNKLKEMNGREAKAIIGDIDGVTQKFAGRPSMFANSVPGAIEAAKKAKKPLPVVVYVADEKTDPLRLLAKLAKDVGDR